MSATARLILSWRSQRSKPRRWRTLEEIKMANEFAEQRVSPAQIEKAIRKRTASIDYRQTGETATA